MFIFFTSKINLHTWLCFSPTWFITDDIWKNKTSLLEQFIKNPEDILKIVLSPGPYEENFACKKKEANKNMYTYNKAIWYRKKLYPKKRQQNIKINPLWQYRNFTIIIPYNFPIVSLKQQKNEKLCVLPGIELQFLRPLYDKDFSHCANRWRERDALFNDLLGYGWLG